MKASFKQKLCLTGIACISALGLLFTGCQSTPPEMDPPDGVQATAAGAHSVDVKWDEAENATGYLVILAPAEQSTTNDTQSEDETGKAETASNNDEETAENETQSSDSSAETLSQPAEGTIAVETETTKATFNELTADTEYCITVSSVYKDDENEVTSEPSETVTVKTQALSVGEVTGLTAAAASDSSLTITWDPYETAETNADGTPAEVTYNLYVSDTQDGEYTLLSENMTDTTYTHTGLPELTPKYYKVSVCLKADCKNFNGAQSGTCANASTNETPKPQQPAQNNGSGNGQGAQNSGSGNGQGGQSSSGANTASSKKAQAMAVAQQIAANIGPGTDLERITKAAQIVNGYCAKGTYTTSGNNYYEAYGVFIAGEYSCAGATRALGMVLDCMGYSWEHANPNQWTHQWCIINNMDGQRGWADGQAGIAGYGEHPAANVGEGEIPVIVVD